MSGRIRRLLGPARERVTRLLQDRPEIKDTFDNDESKNRYKVTLEEFKVRLDKPITRLHNLHQQLTGQDIEGDDEQAVEQHILNNLAILDTVDDLVTEIDISLGRLQLEEERAITRTPPVTQTATQHKINAKLPKLELQKFDGNVLKYFEFWSSFEASIHQNQNIRPVEKLNYLKAQLLGDAAKSISGLATTNENYEVAVELLRNRFGNHQRVLKAHYTAVKDLPVATEQTKSVRQTFDSLEQHLRSLKAMGENVENQMMLATVQSKFAEVTMVRLIELHGGEFADLQAFLHQVTEYLKAHEICENILEVRHSRDNRYSRETNRPTLRSTTTALYSGDQPKKPFCAFCKTDNHWSSDCRKYSTIDERKKKLGQACFSCLRTGHSVRKCRNKRACWYCKAFGHHNPALCPSKFKPAESEGGTNSTSNAIIVADVEESATSTVIVAPMVRDTTLLSTGDTVVLQTATVEVTSNTGKNSNAVTKARILFDSGSHKTYVSAALSLRLNLKPIAHEVINVNTFGTESATRIKTAIVKLHLKLKDGSSFEITANVAPTITGGIDRSPIKELIDPLIYENLADSIPVSQETICVDVLIGSDYYWKLITGQRCEITNNLFAISSKFGWVLSGTHQGIGRGNCSSVSLLTLGKLQPTDISFGYTDSPLHNMPFDEKPLWDLETIGICDRSTEDGDAEAMRKFISTVRYENGRYNVSFPWKEEGIVMPTNYNLALGRLNCLLRRFKDHREMLEKYDAIITDQLKKGVIEKVRECGDTKATHYIPHHAVVTPDKETTKVRIVYDASAKAKRGEKSLNECLHRGPVLLENLCGLLLRFRLHKIVLTADVEKAFLQVGLNEEERNVTRFLWLRNPQNLTCEDNIQVYRFSRLPFGLNCSPFLLAATIKYHLQLENSELSKIIAKGMYVDNLITGTDTEDEALNLYETAKSIFDRAGMNIREWMTNSDIVRSKLSPTDKAKVKATKILGVRWDPNLDTLAMCATQVTVGEVITKRSVVKFIASFFDPLGWIAPMLLSAKLFLQNLWKLKFDWDEQLPTDLQSEWKSIVDFLDAIHLKSIPRHIGGNLGDLYELHVFCDASAKAYGACVYLRIISEDTTKLNLIFAKSRLSPIRKGKPLTIPQLELTAVLVGCRAIHFVSEHLLLNITNQVVWTDSQCVLYWINSMKELPIYENNRIRDIRKFEAVEFRYVSTKDNPADIASRGVAAQELFSSRLWFFGPDWMTKPREQWPEQPIISTVKQADEIELYSAALSGAEASGSIEVNQELVPFACIDYKRYSSYQNLLRVTAYVLRFIKRVKKETIISPQLDSSELNEAKLKWCLYVQKTNFMDIFEALRKNKRHEIVTALDLWIDDSGLLRCGGRLKNISQPLLKIHPILLPKGEYLTQLIIRSVHERLLHAGVSHTLAMLRSEFWIPSGRKEVFKVIQACGKCKRVDGGPYALPPMPPLPLVRVQQATPFDRTGLDFLGPLYVKNFQDKSGGSKKVYGCLFTCMTVRAVHLELVNDMSAENFLCALRRFVARRGRPSVIFSDNAPTFKLVNTTIERAWKRILRTEVITNFTSSENIDWRFITERAPWKGGFYERLVRNVKQALRKTLHKQSLTFTQLQTLFVEIESIINSRPLTYVGANSDDYTTLTPAHFLTINAKIGFPAMETRKLEISDESDRSSTQLFEIWKSGLKRLDSFWKIWSNEYLLSLRERYQHLIRQPRIRARALPEIGNIVLLKNDGPRGTWKLGRLVETLTSADGMIRSARVRLPSGSVLTRSIGHLYPLETTDVSESEDSD